MSSFMVIGIWVPEKIYLYFTIYGHGGHPSYLTWTIYINFLSSFRLRLHENFVFNYENLPMQYTEIFLAVKKEISLQNF